MISEDAAKALRKPFPKSVVGKLPKPYKADSQKGACAECHGYHGLPAVHLDYVGHAAVTDRLLSVDPEWSWEPLAVDDHGLPALDGKGNLWIRLTVCGVSRIGVGDGKSAKEVIGDAIRNAAMRFGVALDMWSKEDLFAVRGSTGDGPLPEPEPTPATRTMRRRTPQSSGPVEAPTPDAPAASVPPGPELITAVQWVKLGAQFRDAGITDRNAALELVAEIVGREVSSRNELTRREASRLVEEMARRLGELPETEEEP